MTFLSFPKHNSCSQPVPLCKLIILPQMLFQYHFIHSPHKYLYLFINSHPSCQLQFTLTSSSLSRDSRLSPIKWPSLGHDTLDFPPKSILFELRLVNSRGFLSTSPSTLRAKRSPPTQIQEKVCCKYLFFHLPSLTFTILLSTTSLLLLGNY